MKYLNKFNENKEDELENDVIKAFKDSVLGREGSLFREMFSGDGKRAIDKLLQKGILVKIKGHQNYSHLPNHEYLGLSGEKYPESQEEFQDYRSSGWSEKVSYSDYLKNKGNIKWDSKKISSFLDKEVREEFNKKVRADDFYINYTRPMMTAIQYAEKLVREDNTPDEVLTKLFIKHATEKFFSLQAIDRKWMDYVLEKRIEYLESEVKNAKSKK